MFHFLFFVKAGSKGAAGFVMVIVEFKNNIESNYNIFAIILYRVVRIYQTVCM